MTKTEMLIQIRNYFDFQSNTEFAAKLCISPQNLNNWFKRNSFDAEVIKSKIPEISSEWLLTGNGNMVNDSENSNIPTAYMKPIVPTSGQGGTLNDFVQSVAFKDCQLIASPVKDVDLAITVAGESMEPTYPNGSIVLIKKINEKAFIDWGKVFVLDTCNGVIVKELHKGKDDSEVECHSLNPDPKYAPYTLKLTDVYGIYRVVMCMTLK